MNFLHIIFFFENCANIKFGENLSSEDRVVLCGQTDMKLIVVFRNFTNALKMITMGSINFSGQMWKLNSPFQNDIAAD